MKVLFSILLVSLITSNSFACLGLFTYSAKGQVVCKHEKKYTGVTLDVYPQLFVWVCQKCGKTGSDIAEDREDYLFEQQVRRFLEMNKDYLNLR